MTRLARHLASAAALAAAATLAAPAFAAPESFSIDPTHTYPSFELNHLGFSVQRGRFNGASGKIVIDRAAKNGTVDLSIDVGTIDMGLEKWDKHMKSEDFFNYEKYSSITFKSNKVMFDGDKVTGVEGDFTLMGVTRPLALTVTNFGCGVHPFNKKNVCGGNAVGAIKRSDFGMKYAIPGIADDVKLLIAFEAFKD
jgi:polyisoprenoid-binding protein YceI